MKISKLTIAGSFLCLLMLGISCKKEFDKIVVENTDLSNKALLKVYNGTISSQRTSVFLADKALSGSVLAYGSVFPSTGYASAIDPSPTANIIIRDTLASSSQQVLNITTNLEAGKKYSIFTYDTVNAIKYLVTEDKVEIPADTTSRLRFVNLIFSKTPLPNVDLFSVKRNQNVFTNIPIGQATQFIPYASRLTDTLYIRETGTTTNLTPVLAVNPTINRSYTVVYRGRYQTTTGTVMPRGLSLISNY